MTGLSHLSFWGRIYCHSVSGRALPLETCYHRAFQGCQVSHMEVAHRADDSGYIEPNWKDILSGQDYRAGAPSGRPDLQRRSAELLSALGPQVAKIQDRYAGRYGWTTNPAVR